ncbi:MAG TPA: AI-2E family transporter [Pyrinomonadaceae bacterium]|nr:AI-2E family transporter [Pyrinomonadaceae bacterium]
MNRKDQAKETTRTAAKAAIEASWPQTRVILRVIIIVLAVLLTLWIIVKLTEVILLLILSVFFAYLVSPLVEFLRQPITIRGRGWTMPRTVAISLAYIIIIGGIVVAIYLLVPRLSYQFPEFAQQARGYWTTVGAKAQTLNEYLRRRVPGPLMESINNEAPNIVHNIGAAVTAIGQQMVARAFYLTWLILIPILSFFFLKDAEMFRRSALQMLPRGRWRWRGDEFFQDVNRTLAAYVRAQLTACLFIGVVCSLGFALLGLPSPLVLGFIAGVFEFIPLLGPLLVAILAAIAATLHAGPFSALMVLLFLGVLRVVQDYFIYPRLVGQGIHLHPLAVILAILAGAELGGVTGIFLAIPAVAILTVSYRHWLEHKGSEGLADLLEPSPTTEPEPSADWSLEPAEPIVSHPNIETTPDEMVRARPDLTTGELKMPVDS